MAVNRFSRHRRDYAQHQRRREEPCELQQLNRIELHPFRWDDGSYSVQITKLDENGRTLSTRNWRQTYATREDCQAGIAAWINEVFEDLRVDSIKYGIERKARYPDNVRIELERLEQSQ